MSWTTCDQEKAKQHFIEDWLEDRHRSFAALCRRHGISRVCGYKWLLRFRAGGVAGLHERSRRPASARRLREVWQKRLLQAHLQEPQFGPKKLRWKLRRDHPRRRPPGVRTLARWRQELGKVRTPTRRARPGPSVRVPGRLVARCANDVWSADIKGSFCSGDGQRVPALTVRDLATRFVLCVRHLPQADERHVGRVMHGLFGRYGLPRAIRCDNGAPFGGDGPRGWSRLSVRWVKLGVRTEYGRPRHPEDNPHHEQMHRVLKRATASPAAPDLGAQQRRFDRWRQRYNHHRPHESLGMAVPAAKYRPSKRALPDNPSPHDYPSGWELLRPDDRGRCFWRGRQRLIGKAFLNETLGGKPLGAHTLAVYFREHLIGTLHQDDLAGLRGVPRHTHQYRAGGAAPLPAPTPIFRRSNRTKL